MNTSISGSQLKGRSRLKISTSDVLIGMVRRLLRVGISSGNQALTRCAFAGTNTDGE
jgi:hypothetical protein